MYINDKNEAIDVALHLMDHILPFLPSHEQRETDAKRLTSCLMYKLHEEDFKRIENM